MTSPTARLIAAALLLHCAPAVADVIELDLPTALVRARQWSSPAISARARIDRADAAIIGADVAFIDNPELEIGAGPRLAGGHPIDADARLSQELDLGRRGPRRDLARAERAHSIAERDDVQRRLDLEVAMAFYDAVYATSVVELGQRSEDVAARAAEAMQKKRKAGEITDLELDLARIALGRARSTTHLARAERTTAIGKLALLVGATSSTTIELRGTLAPPPLPASGRAAERADVVASRIDQRVADAEHASAVANGRPSLGVFIGYQREDSDSIVLGGLRITLPLWNAARGERAGAAAHQRATLETYGATRRQAERESVDARAAYELADRAVTSFEADVLPALGDSEQLLDSSIAASQITITGYLVARQEVLAARREYLDRQLARAKAAASVRFAEGGVR